MTRFLLIRHGETTWNKSGRVQGQQNSPLNDRGRAQAQALARVLGQQQRAVTQLISSDLGRTQETAQPIAHALRLPMQLDLRLRERSFGNFEGLSHAEMAARDLVAFATLRSRLPSFAPLGGESLLALQARLVACIEDLAARYPGDTVCVVTHGGVLDVLYRHATSTALDAQRTWALANASINTIDVDARGDWRLVAWGEVGHLVTSEDERFS